MAEKSFDIIKRSKLLMIISACLIVVGIILAFTIGPNYGIEFSGGVELEVEINELTENNFDEYETIVAEQLKLLSLDVSNATKLTYNGKISMQFQFKNEINNVEVNETVMSLLDNLYRNGGNNVEEADRATLRTYLGEDFDFDSYVGIMGALKGSTVTIYQTSIGASASKELFSKALKALAVALAAVLVYILIRFWNVGKFASACAAIIALIHDVLIMITLMLIAGAIFDLQINENFVAAVVTIVCYSINNTIVIFDRIRENQLMYNTAPSDTLANMSVREVLKRTIFASLTTFVAVLVLTIIGVPSVREFTIPIMFGLVAGTYSAFFIATPLWAMFKGLGKKNAGKNDRKGAVQATQKD
ncbi:MAG: protein translocase subunit SecF [Clostridia bacterium]|nr:protein translocase subunit SecF [Clostridia bacterium]